MKELSAKQREAIARALAKPVSQGETGQADPLFAQVQARGSYREQLERLYEIFAQIRLIIPVFPHAQKPSSAAPDTACPPGEFTLIKDARGQKVLAAYSSVAQMRQDFPEGRPVPVLGRNLALLACQHPGTVLVDGRYHCPQPFLEAVGVGDSYLPPWRSRELVAALEQLCQDCSLEYGGLFPQEAAGVGLAVTLTQTRLEEAYRQIAALESALKTRPELLLFLPNLNIVPLKAAAAAN